MNQNRSTSDVYEVVFVVTFIYIGTVDFYTLLKKGKNSNRYNRNRNSIPEFFGFQPFFLFPPFLDFSNGVKILDSHLPFCFPLLENCFGSDIQ